jgi:hypothetical protein
VQALSSYSEGTVPKNRGAEKLPTIPPPTLQSIKTGQEFTPSPSKPSAKDLQEAKVLLSRSGYPNVNPLNSSPKREEINDDLPALISDSDDDDDDNSPPKGGCYYRHKIPVS